MKITKFLLVLVLACTVVVGYSQKKVKPFVGIIKYDVSYVGEEFNDVAKAQLPMEACVKVNETKISAENISATFSTTFIYDSQTKGSILLFDMMGQKVAVNMSNEDASEEDDNEVKPEIIDLNEIKTINGYKCSKYQMPFVGSEEDYVILYIAKDIAISKDLNKKGIMPLDVDGGILEIVIYQGNNEISYVANEVKKGKVKKSDFIITDDYNELTQEEFKSMIGQ